jgi:hypothetical protein
MIDSEPRGADGTEDRSPRDNSLRVRWRGLVSRFSDYLNTAPVEPSYAVPGRGEEVHCRGFMQPFYELRDMFYSCFKEEDARVYWGKVAEDLSRRAMKHS